MHLPTSNRKFAAIEQLDELPRALGCPREYRQIEPGSFSSTVTNVVGDSWFLMEEQSSRNVEVVAGAPDGIFLLALVDGAPVAVNGKTLTADHIFLQTPGSDFRATLPAGTKVTQLGVAAELFEDVLRAIGQDLPVPHGDVATLATAPGQLASVRWDMRAAILAPSVQEASRDEAASSILGDLLANTLDQGQAKIGRDLHRAAARRVLVRAREYIEANLDRVIRISSLCQHSGASPTTLERLFARELGVPPSQYVLARRLNAVRRRLLAAGEANAVRVTAVAQDHGFAHLGRFAEYYRRYFGESPQETLHRRRPRAVVAMAVALPRTQFDSGGMVPVDRGYM